jgi:hypothetical protein
MALDASVSLSEVYMVLIHGKSPRKSTWLCTPVIAAEKEKRGERGEKKETETELHTSCPTIGSSHFQFPLGTSPSIPCSWYVHVTEFWPVEVSRNDVIPSKSCSLKVPGWVQPTGSIPASMGKMGLVRIHTSTEG